MQPSSCLFDELPKESELDSVVEAILKTFLLKYISFSLISLHTESNLSKDPPRTLNRQVLVLLTILPSISS